MADSRLTRALEDGAVSIPEDVLIAVFAPAADFDLSALPPGRVVIVQRFRTAHDAWARRGYSVQVDAPQGVGAALVCLPRARASALGLIAEAVSAVPAGAPVLVDGQKDQGVDSALKTIRSVFHVAEAFSKAHGKVFQFASGPVPEPWHARPGQIYGGFVTAPGVFSADGIDPGSNALAQVLPRDLKGRAADLGAGWGYLSACLLERGAIQSVDLVEADFTALEAARQNVTDPRASFHWADVTRFQHPSLYDHIVSNPPFHVGRRADPELGRRFIAAAAGMLAPRGVLWMVANRHLPYEAALNDAFSEVSELPGPSAFKLFRAARPRRRR